MKPTTRIKIGLNHIGESGSAPEIFDGTLRESLEWLIALLTSITLARRIQISIARTDEEVMVGLTTQRKPRNDSKLASAMDLLSALTLLDDDSLDGVGSEHKEVESSTLQRQSRLTDEDDDSAEGAAGEIEASRSVAQLAKDSQEGTPQFDELDDYESSASRAGESR